MLVVLFFHSWNVVCSDMCIWLEENAIIIVSIDVIASDDHHSVDNDVKKKQKLYFPCMLCEFLK